VSTGVIETTSKSIQSGFTLTLNEIKASLPDFKKSSDSKHFWVRFFVRPLSFPTTWLLLKLGLSANQVTFLSIALSGAAGFMYSQGGYSQFIIAAGLSHGALLLDSVDGNMARATGTSGPLGWMLDTMAADLFYLAFFIPIGIGVINSSDYGPLMGEPEWVYMGLGTLASTSVLFYRLFRYRAHQATIEATSGQAAPGKVGPTTATQRSFARRSLPIIYGNLVPPTGTVLPVVTIMAILGLMDYFIWIYGIGVAAAASSVVLYQLWRTSTRASAG
jgi:phosphatidylglycerophosphate synthase